MQRDAADVASMEPATAPWPISGSPPHSGPVCTPWPCCCRAELGHATQRGMDRPGGCRSGARGDGDLHRRCCPPTCTATFGTAGCRPSGINPYVYLPADPALDALRDDGARDRGDLSQHQPRRLPHRRSIPRWRRRSSAAIGLAWPTMLGREGRDAGLRCAGHRRGAAAVADRRAAAGGMSSSMLGIRSRSCGSSRAAAHIDAPAVALSALALLAAARHRPGWAGAALAGAILCKLLPAALFPAIWRWPKPAHAAGLRTGDRGGLRLLCRRGLARPRLPARLCVGGRPTDRRWVFHAAAPGGTVRPLPRWAGTVYMAIALAGLLALAWMDRVPGRRCRTIPLHAVIVIWARGPMAVHGTHGRIVAALPMVFHGAGACPLSWRRGPACCG